MLTEPAHEIMVLFCLRKLILQTRMCSHPVGLEVGFLVGPFVYFHTSSVQTAKALARLPRCAGSPEPSMIAYVISAIISWAGSNQLTMFTTLFIRLSVQDRCINSLFKPEQTSTFDLMFPVFINGISMVTKMAGVWRQVLLLTKVRSMVCT